MKRRGWTLLELMVAGSALLLLLALSTLALSSYARSLRGLQQEGDQLARAAHTLEKVQSLILQARPIAPGTYDLKTKFEVTLSNGGKQTLPVENIKLTSRQVDGRTWIQLVWNLPSPLPPLKSSFEATTWP
ncbi:MAG: hypothetical protein U0931_29225 [Vulcanimicrobiota bacterium]